MASLIGFSSTAHAADVYPKGGQKEGPVEAFPPLWAGLYVGGSVGHSWGEISDTATIAFDPAPIGGGSITGSDDLDGATFGAHLGYNFQYGNFVLGPEVGINSFARDAAVLGNVLPDGPIRHELNWYATAVGRLGYAHDEFLLYGFGGVAWSKVRTVPPANADDDVTMFVGWTAGAGVEYALSDRFSLRLEYAHVDLGSEQTLSSSTPVTPDTNLNATNDTGVAFDVIKLGASYRLGGGGESLE